MNSLRFPSFIFSPLILSFLLLSNVSEQFFFLYFCSEIFSTLSIDCFRSASPPFPLFPLPLFCFLIFFERFIKILLRCWIWPWIALLSSVRNKNDEKLYYISFSGKFFNFSGSRFWVKLQTRSFIDKESFSFYESVKFVLHVNRQLLDRFKIHFVYFFSCFLVLSQASLRKLLCFVACFSFTFDVYEFQLQYHGIKT